jgi:hypothetical protein
MNREGRGEEMNPALLGKIDTIGRTIWAAPSRPESPATLLEHAFAMMGATGQITFTATRVTVARSGRGWLSKYVQRIEICKKDPPRQYCRGGTEDQHLTLGHVAGPWNTNAVRRIAEFTDAETTH